MDTFGPAKLSCIAVEIASMAGTSKSRTTTQSTATSNHFRRDEGFCVILVVSPVSDLDAGRPVSGRIMPFEVGDRVVYPHHGAAIVDRRETRKAFGQEIEYLVLKVAHGDLTVSRRVHRRWW